MDQRSDWHLTEALGHEHGRGDPFAAAVRATRMPMVITNPRLPDNPIVYCNEAFQKLSGYDRDEIVGRNCRFLQGTDTDRNAVAEIRGAIDAGTDHTADLLNYRKDGTTFWNALYLSPVRDHIGDITFFFASQLDVSDRIDAHRNAVAARQAVEREVAARTADLERALDAKTMLLHELDHRVKNNLSMVGSLLRLQIRASDDPSVAHRLESLLARVDALGTVHRQLYQSADVTRFDIGSLVQHLATDLVSAAGNGRIALVTDIVPIDIASGHAAAIGLILNEVLTNAVEHAYADGRAGTLRLNAARHGVTARIDIADDGPGIPDGAANGLGHNIVERLSGQLGVQPTWTTSAAGTRVSLVIPLGDTA